MIELLYEAGTLVAFRVLQAAGAFRLGRKEPPVAGPSERLPQDGPEPGERRTRQAPDRAAAFEKVPLESRVAMEPRPYQREALGAWRKAGLRGVVVLPTGAGKTAVAMSAMERVGRSTLVVVPTLALLKQWYSVLQDAFGGSVTIGLLGGGYREITPLTVTTYDSAYIHAERYGDRFALVVYDEVHHLPAPKNAIIPRMLLAPYALGLTATPERPDGGHELLPDLAGEIVYPPLEPEDLAGTYLAPFRACPHTHRADGPGALRLRPGGGRLQGLSRQASAADALPPRLGSALSWSPRPATPGGGRRCSRRGGGVRSGRAP